MLVDSVLEPLLLPPAVLEEEVVVGAAEQADCQQPRPLLQPAEEGVGLSRLLLQLSLLPGY